MSARPESAPVVVFPAGSDPMDGRDERRHRYDDSPERAGIRIGDEGTVTYERLEKP